jgi:hypothetical protein
MGELRCKDMRIFVSVIFMGALLFPQGHVVASATLEIFSVTVDKTSYGARIRIEGTHPMDYAVFQLAGPRRLIVDVRDADVSRAETPEVYEHITSGVESISGFKIIDYELEDGSIGRLQFLLTEPFSTSSYQEGSVIFVELTRVEDPASADRGASTSLPEVEEYRKERVEEEKPPAQWSSYSTLNISIMNFDAPDVPWASATAFGAMVVGGYRIGEIVSFEAGVNWLPIGDSSLVLPIPMMWMPADNGLYLNLAGGMRFNLVRYSDHDAVPWINVWRVGHAVVSDFSVAGSGWTWGIGCDFKKGGGKITQIALRVHQFKGDLTIYEGDWDFDYGKQDIRAVELVIGFSTK